MKTDKKELIFKAMEQLMSEVPYKDISVDSIAKKAGIGKGSIYYYFKSKDEILYSVIERSYRRAVHDFFENIHSRPETTVMEKIKMLFLSTIKRDFSGNEKNLLITLHLHDDTTLHQKMKCAAVQEIAPVLTQLLNEGVTEGVICTNTPKESAEIIVAVLTFFLDESFFSEDLESMHNKLKILSEVFETCLKTGKGSFDFLYNGEAYKNTLE